MDDKHIHSISLDIGDLSGGVKSIEATEFSFSGLEDTLFEMSLRLSEDSLTLSSSSFAAFAANTIAFVLGEKRCAGGPLAR